MLIEYIEHIVKYYRHLDAILFLNTENIIEYSAYFSREKNQFIVDDFLGKNIFEIYPGLTEENSVNCRVRRTGKPILTMPVTNRDYKNRVFHFISSTFPLFINQTIVGTVEFSVYDDDKYFKANNRAPSDLYHFNDFIGENINVVKMKQYALRIAKSDSPALIYGETGVGKEIIAQAVCSASSRGEKPFLTVNCSAIPANLMESTLFGTVKGSFTGAIDRKGFFEAAKGGTLFLDELNSMELQLQAKLLRAIENREIYRVGSNNPISTDVRLVVAMNEQPLKAIQNGRLRSDLYYRLSVAQIYISPLRERREDIKYLLQAFIERFNVKYSKEITGVTNEVIRRFMAYDWPGNVRELKNVMEYAFLVSEGPVITLEDLPETIERVPERSAEALAENTGLTLKEKMQIFEKGEIEKALKWSRNLMEVAEALGISRQVLQYKMKKYGLK